MSESDPGGRERSPDFLSSIFSEPGMDLPEARELVIISVASRMTARMHFFAEHSVAVIPNRMASVVE